MKQLLSSGFRPVLRPEAEMLLRLRSPNDDTAKVRTKLREAGLCPTRTRMALSALLFSKGDRHVTAEGRGLVHGGSAFFAARAYSSCSQRAISPPMTPPTIGATQNSQSDPSAALPPKMAVAVERAGFTDAINLRVIVQPLQKGPPANVPKGIRR